MKKTLFQKAVLLGCIFSIPFLPAKAAAQDTNNNGGNGGSNNSGGSTNGGNSIGTPGSTFNSADGSTYGTVPITSTGDNTGQGHFSQPKFHSNISLREGYDDNVNTTNTNKTRSGFTDLEANAFANGSSGSTAFTLGVAVGITSYYSNPSNNLEYLASLNLNVSHRVNERLTLSLASYTTYQVQPDYSLNVAQNRVNGQYIYTGDTFSASYQWTRRFSTVTSYSITGIFYADSIEKGNDYFENSFSNQFRFLLRPTTTLVFQYNLALIDYLTLTQRNTISNSLLVGFDHSFSPKFTVSLRAGGQMQSQEGQGGASTSPSGQLTLNYLYRRNSSISFNMNYGFQYSNVGVNQNDRSLSMGFTLTQGFTPKLSAYLGLYYEHDDFSQSGTVVGSSSSDDTFSISTGVRFTLNSRWSFQAGYTRTQLLSDISSQTYDRDVFTFGATYSF